VKGIFFHICGCPFGKKRVYNNKFKSGQEREGEIMRMQHSGSKREAERATKREGKCDRDSNSDGDKDRDGKTKIERDEESATKAQNEGGCLISLHFVSCLMSLNMCGCLF